MHVRINHPGKITKESKSGWFIVVEKAGSEGAGYLIIYSKEFVFDDNGRLLVSQSNTVYDKWLLTIEEVSNALEDLGVEWLD